MSDFFSDGWSIFIGVSTIVSLAACLVLLFGAMRNRPMGDDNSTGHVFDGDLREMNNPMPLWWMVLFVLTVIFAFGYVYAFPALGSRPGSLGWSSRGEHDADKAKATAEMAKVYAGYTQLPAEALSRDPKAMAIGQRLFINNCATCHGSDARGSKGFPDLTDRDWIHGGTPEKIEETITLGRTGVMPPMAMAVGSPQDVHNVAHYVLSLSGSPNDSIAAAAGKSKFAVCAACHGVDGKGNQAIGAPNLTDKVWLHGWGEDAIADMVNHGKTNVMPAQSGRLLPEQIHLLAAYVWNLSQPRQTASK
ncbi:MAG: cytochrome-c oxidase, cbb3-type subunit III [Caldimonas sp.]